MVENIVFILMFVILVGGLINLFTREEKEEIITNQYNLIQTQNNPIINVIFSDYEYMLIFVMENNNKAVFKKVHLNKYFYKNNIEFIANNNVMPNVQIIEKNFYETNLIHSIFNKDYRKNESKEYTYIFTLKNDDVVETLNKINAYEE